MAVPSVWGRLQFKVPLHMLKSTFVTTPFNPGNVAAGSSPVGSLITPYVRGVFRGGWVGRWEGWLCGDRVLLSRGWPGPRIVKDTNCSKGGWVVGDRAMGANGVGGGGRRFQSQLV